MRHHAFSHLLAGLLCLAAWSGCVRDGVAPAPAPATHTVLFSALPSPETPATRSAFAGHEDGRYPTRWTSRDTAVAVSLNYGTPAAVRPVRDADGRSAEFAYTFEGKASSYAFQALSPASAVLAMSASRKAWQLRIPAVQTPSATSPDEAAQLLSARTAASETLPQRLELYFDHVTAYGRLTLKHLPEDAAIEAVTLSCSVPLAGEWYLSPETGILEPKDASSTIILKTSRADSLWFACAPGDVSGQTLKVIVTTDKGVYEKAIRFHRSRTFLAGGVSAFSVDFSGITPLSKSDEFRLVTDASSLAPGDELLIVDASGRYAISPTQNTNNRAAVSVKVKDKTVTLGAEEAEHFFLEREDGAWLLRTRSTGGYLKTVSGKNRLLTSAPGETEDFCRWTVSIESNGAATLMAPTSQENRYLVLNSLSASNILFSCYKSMTGYTLPSLYRRYSIPGDPYGEDPILEKTVYGAYLSSGETLYAEGRSQLSREWEAAGTLRFAILEPAAKSVLELSGIPATPLIGDRFLLTCTRYAGVQQSSKEYTVTVLKVDGARLWLSDGKGNGFIVKR